MTPTEIKQRAVSMRKAGKRVAHQAISNIIDGWGDNDENMAILYSYFMPSIKTTKPKTNADWVARAVAKNGIRHYLNFLYEANGKLVGTDGHRLHWIESDKDRGFMHPVTFDLAGDVGTFPKVDFVINQQLSERREEIKLIDIPVHVSPGGKTKLCTLFGRTFNYQYIVDVYGMDDTMNVRETLNGNQTHFTSLDGVRNGIVMALRD